MEAPSAVCPKCSEQIKALTAATLPVQVDQDSAPRTVAVLTCGNCNAVLGVDSVPAIQAMLSIMHSGIKAQ